MLFEVISGLYHQRHSIGKKQNPLGPVRLHQQFAQRDDRPRFSGPGGHHDQRLAILVRFECFTDSPDRTNLVIAAHDLRIDRSRQQRPARRPPLDQQFQFRFFVEPLNRPRRIIDVIPEPVFVTIRIEDHRSLTVHGFQTIGVQLRLLLTNASVMFGSLGFDYGQRLSVVAPQDVIDLSDPLIIWHSGDFELTILFLIQCPAGFFQQQIDEVIACLRFRIVMRIWLRNGSLANLREFGSQPLQLFIQRIFIGQQLRQFLVFVPQLGRKLLQLFQRLTWHRSRSRQRCRVKCQSGLWTILTSVRMRQPVADMKQFLHRDFGIALRNRPMMMHGPVSQRHNHFGLIEDRITGNLLERRLMNQRGDIVLVGQLQAAVELVGPRHGQFQSSARIEARRARICQRQRFCLAGGFMDGRKLRQQKLEVAHPQNSPNAIGDRNNSESRLFRPR